MPGWMSSACARNLRFRHAHGTDQLVRCLNRAIGCTGPHGVDMLPAKVPAEPIVDAPFTVRR